MTFLLFVFPTKPYTEPGVALKVDLLPLEWEVKVVVPPRYFGIIDDGPSNIIARVTG